MKPTETKQNRHNLHAKATLALYWRATAARGRRGLLALTLPASAVVLSVFVPFFASHVLADIIGNHAHTWYDFWWFAGLALAGVAGNMVGIRESLALQARVMDDLERQLFDRLLSRSVGFFNDQIGGKLVSDTLDFVNSYGTLFNVGFIQASGFALTIVIGLAIVTLSNWLIGFAMTVLLGMLLWWTVEETKKRSALRGTRLKLSKALTANVSDNIVNAVTVKTFAQEARELAANAAISGDLAKARIIDWQRSTSIESLRMGVLLVTQAALLLLLIWLTRRDPHLLATGIFAFTYTITLVNRFFTINTITRQIEEAFLNASPMTELLSQPVEIADAPDAKPLKVKRGEIVCSNTTFAYVGSAAADRVFDGLNLHIRAGEKIGLVGHSGGGKSTLTRLLLRFDDVTGGAITIDGQDIRGVTQASLRGQIAYVPQEPLLFHRTIRENIAYGRPGASLRQIQQAARLAYAHDFITALPHQYDTTVGERGVKLSGGQRQRVAIARAILKNAPILVLDEATSALDSESEKAIQKALWELMDGKTAVVVAHRLSTIQKMDRILVLSMGRIVEDGSHAELLATGGTYAKLWAHQSGGFIED